MGVLLQRKGEYLRIIILLSTVGEGYRGGRCQRPFPPPTRRVASPGLRWRSTRGYVTITRCAGSFTYSSGSSVYSFETHGRGDRSVAQECAAAPPRRYVFPFFDAGETRFLAAPRFLRSVRF